MAYTCDLGSGQRLYLENIGEQTAVTMAVSRTGQQQQSSSRFTSGSWTQAPEVFQTQQGIVIRLHTTQGTHHAQLQGSQLSVMSPSPSLGSAQQMSMQSGVAMPGTSPAMDNTSSMSPLAPMEPLPPLPPMQPLQMDNMEMNIQPMHMRMGNMEMQLGNSKSSATDQPQATSQRNFCTQCGTAVQSGDRFCAHCGHQLQR
ncbi:MAG: zinc ribbon domain-containing protein [Cyanobacteria bacterium P01_C01_bin.120]